MMKRREEASHASKPESHIKYEKDAPAYKVNVRSAKSSAGELENHQGDIETFK